MSDPVISTTSDSFQTAVLQSATPVVVEFTARWCPPCRRLEPLVRELAARHTGRLKVVVVDVEDAPELAQTYSVTSMPTLLAFRNGAVVAQQVGFSGRPPVERFFASLAEASG